MEIWRDIKGYEGLYQVSSCGRVKNSNGHIMSPADNGNGYLRFSLSSGHRKYKTHYLHRLMAESFIPNPENLPEVNHKDENKKNNDITNLEWCTVKFNRDYGTRVKRYSEKNKRMIIGKPLNGGKEITFDSATDAARLGFNRNAISNCLIGFAQTHHGFAWRYAS